MSDIEFKDFKISENIIEAINKLGYKKPSRVQSQVIPLVLEDKDLIVKSQTGSGKTAAFGIPLCDKVDIENNFVQVLVLSPTRELCLQIKEDITNIGRIKRVRCSAIFGKQPFEVQKRELSQRVHIVTGTPGRTFDHIERGTLKVEGIKYFVLDEADEMLNMGFIDQVEAIIKRLPKDRVTLLFSATVPEEIEKICAKYMREPIKVEINPTEMTTTRIEHVLYEIEEKQKDILLNKILITENPDSSIIFCRTKENVDSIAAKLKEKKYPCAALHGGLLQNERLEVIKGFKRGEFRYLIATDVAARGIDVENVTHIINYDIPLEKESYVHRIGRTGRAGKEGKAITFITPYEDKFLAAIEEYIGFKLSKKEEPSNEEVKLARKDFNEKINTKPELKEDKGSALLKDITKIYLGAGKKKKLRAGDVVGAISSIEGVSAEDIGIIDILDYISYVEILNGKGARVLKTLKNKPIKGKLIKVEKAENKK